METNDIRESIYKNFTNLQDMVKFAEAKNTALLAASGIITGLVYDKICFNSFPQWMFSLGYLFINISIIIALYSFKPNKGKKEKNNMFLFSNIAQYSSFDQFRICIIDRYYSNKSNELSPFMNIEEDIIQQIYNLGIIANRKFDLFKYAMYSFSLGLLLIVIFGNIK